MIFETIFVAGLLAIFHWIFSRGETAAAVMLGGIDTLLVLLAVHGGSYWSIFPRGHGYWTANRISALALLLAAIWVPMLLRALRERLIAPE